MATEWETWKLCTSVCAEPQVGISRHSLCGGPWVNLYNSVRRISRWWRKCSSVCALISVSVWGKLVLKHTKCCMQLSEIPAEVDRRHLSGIPVSIVDADPLKTTPPPRQAFHRPHRGDRGTCARNH
jgi:hypothetical protein